MFAHQVIEDLKKLKIPDSRYPKWEQKYREIVPDYINNSIKFHHPNMEIIDKMAKLPRMLDVEKHFINNKDYIKLPYKNIWFDYVKPNNEHTSKYGLLVISDSNDSELFSIHLFAFLCGFWQPQPRICYVNKSKNIIGVTTLKGVEKIIDDDSEDYILLQNSMANECLSFINFILLLNCKNIGTETIPAPVKLNNKRKKKGKQPIFSYKTLVIKPTTKKEQSIPKHLWNNRIHLARGHFKTYTEDKPLFGRITGRFWWQPHVRGQNRDGVVMKDYKVEA